MKALKAAILALISLTLIATACACNKEPAPDDTPTEVYYTVSFLSTGSEIESVKVKDGEKIEKPDTPEREGYVFNGWSVDGNAWDFAEGKVGADMTLVAEWLEADRVYSFESTPDGARITAVLRKLPEMSVPSTINGIRTVEIGEAAFADISCSEVSSITVADTVTRIERGAFARCVDVEITVRGALTYVGEAAFEGCNRLRAISFASGLTEIPYRAFAGCSSLSAAMLPNTLELVDENAFEDCSSLRTVALHPSTARIADAAFEGCERLERVCFVGTSAQFDAIAVDGLNAELAQATVYFYSENQPDTEGSYFCFDSKGNVKFW